MLTVNIKAAVLASEQALREAGIELSDFVRGNEKARERMKAQYSIAGMTKVGRYRPCGEAAFTNDGGTDINPIFRWSGPSRLRNICRSCPPPTKTIAPPAG